MARATSFLDPRGREEFSTPGRLVPRSAVRRDTAGSRPLFLTDLIRGRLAELERLGAGNWFQCFSVTVKQDDGMSWTAESVVTWARDKQPRFHCWLLAGNIAAESLPVVADLVGVKTFLRLAARHQLTSSFLTLRSWMTPLIVALAILVSMAVAIANALLKTATPDKAQDLGRALADPRLYALTLAVAALGLVSQYLVSQWLTRTKSKSLEEFRKELKEKEQTQRHAEFADELARKLVSLDFPRLVVVDNFERLDYTTRQVVLRYFEEHCERRSGSEFWVVFEGEDGERLSLLRQRSPKAPGAANTRLLQQTLLTADEKRRLVRAAALPEGAAEFTTVKRICSGERGSLERFHTLFVDHRKKEPANPAQYGSLEFLYLCSLTSSPAIFFFTHRSLRHDLAVKGGPRSEVLGQLLPNSRLTQEEIGQRLIDLNDNFSSVLILAREGDPTEFRVVPEAADVLRDHARELGLKHPGLGHVFWSLFWYAKLRGRPVEAFWIRKLIQHLAGARASEVSGDTYPRMLGPLLEIVLYAIDGGLRTGLFEGLPALIEKAVLLLDNTQSLPLLRACWESSFLLEPAKMLDLVVELSGRTPAGGPKPGARALESRFLDFLPLAPLNRDRVHAAARLLDPSILDHASVRAAWLLLSLEQNTQPAAKEFAVWAGPAREVDRVVEGARQRLAGSADRQTVDLMTLSLGLWCLGLRSSRMALAGIPGLEPLAAAELSALLPSAAQAVDQAHQARTPAGPSRGTDYLRDALWREVCVMAAAALTAAAHYLGKLLEVVLAGDFLDRARTTLEAAGRFLDADFPPIARAADLAKPELWRKVDEQLELCAVLWQTFGLDPMRDFIHIRRAHLHSICRGVKPEDYPAYSPLVEALGSAVHERSFTGLVANSVLSAAFIGSAELSAHYSRQAASIALAEPLGADVQYFFALQAVYLCRQGGYDLKPALEFLAPDALAAAPLARFLGELPPDGASGAVLRFLNVARGVGDPALTGRVRQLIAAFLDRTPAGDLKDDLLALLDIFELDEAAARGEQLPPDAPLVRWSNRRQSWTYPWLLELLLRSGSRDPQVFQESAAVLDRDPWRDQFNTYLFLAITVLALRPRDGRPEDLKAPLGYLKGAIRKWQGELSAAKNVEAYHLLHDLDRHNQAAYFVEICKWEAIRLHWSHLKKLPELARLGRFFLIFQEYCASMFDWGLPVDAADFLEMYHAGPNDRVASVEGWKAEGAVVPSPLVDVAGGRAISTRFLSIGRYLFSPPLDQNSDYDSYRQAFHEAARANFADLVSVIITLPRLPKSLRELLVDHSQRLQHHAPLPDLEAAAGG